ncbi:unnamed protein product, partial [Nesidiocoris tenuis]
MFVKINELLRWTIARHIFKLDFLLNKTNRFNIDGKTSNIGAKTSMFRQYRTSMVNPSPSPFSTISNTLPRDTHQETKLT